MTPSMWMKLLQYGAPALAVIALLLWVDNRGYDRGHDAAEYTCRILTVPNAKDEMRKQCEILTNATKEENDALTHNLNRLRGTYDRLRQKPTAACVPIAVTRTGDARPDATAKHTERMGVSTEWLDLAFYNAATDIERGESCQRQLARIYELNGAAK
jgi:hypothetical protein